MTLHRFSVSRVRGRLRQGSSSPVVVETEGGPFVAKLRGAGHGVLALAAEIIVAEVAERLELPVPERVFLELPPDVPTDDRNDELADLLHGSTGINLGFRFLEGAREPSAQELRRLDDEFAVRVLWLDGLMMNPDRTTRNPNILLWKNQPWLIDHGAALAFHYSWALVTEDSPREPANYLNHVFDDRIALLDRFDPVLARCLTEEVLAKAIMEVPDAYLGTSSSGETPSRGRAAYHAFLWKRLKAPRPFLRRL